MAAGPVDCHCHLAAPCFHRDVAAVVRAAEEAAVAALVVVAEQAAEFRRVMELSESESPHACPRVVVSGRSDSGQGPPALCLGRAGLLSLRNSPSPRNSPSTLSLLAHVPAICHAAAVCSVPRFPGFVLPCLGVHPLQEVSPEEQRSVTLKDLDDALPLIELYKDKLVAIGEVGLDFTPRFASMDEQKEEQRQVLIKQIELARRLDLPLNVHSRSAGRPTINLLKEQVLLHAFDGKPSVAMEGVKAGYYFSIPPSIIRSEQQKLVKLLPLENICLETDSPALGPEKQVRNEPKNIYIAAEYIAKIKGIPVEEVIEVTTQNALKVFPKLRNFVHV
ncbi:putative deoxyribonuclease TATDN3 isoform X4 [Anser cygnoides]|uniref:putative deoxyribonuclease TATDN3 isoform X4 n=1 Tax=Anser cygnoides TaxID=8845 RepID=UPI0034D159BB